MKQKSNNRQYTQLEYSPLQESLGKSPSLAILSFLIAHRYFDYTKTDLAKSTGLCRQTIYYAIEPLLKFEIIKISRKIGNTTLYKLNLKSEITNAAINLNKKIVDLIIELEKKKKGS